MPKFAKRYVLGVGLVYPSATGKTCGVADRYGMGKQLRVPKVFNDCEGDDEPRYRLVLERVGPRTEAVRPTKRMEADTD